jgi:U3 small nucleolar ribonucleoprotein component
MDTPLGTSAGRQKTLQALEEQTELSPIDEPTGINDLTDALTDIAVERVLSPPQKTVEQIDEIHTALPEDAQPHYVSDEIDNNSTIRKIARQENGDCFLSGCRK